MIQNILLHTILVLAVLTASKYILYFLSSLFYSVRKNRYLEKSKNVSKEDLEQNLKISVIVPAWNEGVGIIDCIRSLYNSNYSNLEIIVVNDGSVDDSDLKVNLFIKTELSNYPKSKSFQYIYKKNGGKGSAINAGIRKSTGSLIVTMDADTIFDVDALSNAARYFYSTDLDAAVGNVKIANSKSILGVIQQIEYTVGFYFKRSHSVFGSEYIIGGAFGIFRRSVFEKYGYFDELNKTEDIEYSTRLQTKGCSIFYIEDAVAYTEGPASLDDLMKQRLRWKKGRLDTFLKYKALFFSSKRHHRKFLTFYLLPITLFYEVELLFEPIFTLFGMYYVITTGKYLPIIYWILFTSLIYMFTFLSGFKKNSKIALLLTPAYFFLSYILTFVEVYAMYTSIKMFIKRQEIVWQTWHRKGLDNV